MRWIVCIMSLYMLVLIAVPCADIADFKHFDTHETESAEGHAHDDTDHCSPFCHCACCGVSITNLTFEHPRLTYIVSDFNSKDILPKRNPIFISSYFEDIWQPPQLVSRQV